MPGCENCSDEQEVPDDGSWLSRSQFWAPILVSVAGTLLGTIAITVLARKTRGIVD